MDHNRPPDDFTAVVEPDCWKKYFADAITIPIRSNERISSINVYKTYTRLKLKQENKNSEGTLIFCIHGCGLSAMSWASTARLVSQHAFVAAVDLKGHGSSFTSREDTKSIHISGLILDLKTALGYLLQEFKSESIPPPNVIFLGHSLGGALCIKLASQLSICELLAIIIIDFVEDAVSQGGFRNTIQAVNAIPTSFSTMEDALQWTVESGSCLNVESAKISLPSQLVWEQNELRWKCHPKETKPYWEEWVNGATREFLTLKCMKVMILRDYTTLCKQLTTAHMQGSFVVKLLPGKTHVIHEDSPKEVADIILEVISRGEYNRKMLHFINKRRIGN